MISDKENIKTSKFLSLVLRHQPETIGLELDMHGWADVKELIKKTNENGIKLDLAILRYIVDSNSKKRFSMSDDLSRIRASQGHSVEVDLGYAAQIPPDTLYHCTAAQNVESILELGIQKRDRQHVHLSYDIETAVKVGQRHGKPVIFEVNAAKMHADDLGFYLSENGVWLTNDVPAKYLKQMETPNFY